MNPGIRDRFRWLPGSDRLLLLLTVGWTITGTAGNYFRPRHLTDGTGQYWFYLMMTLWAVIAGVVVDSLLRQKRRLADYGFSFNMGGVASLAIIAAIHVYLVLSGKLDFSASGSYQLSALGAFMEELIVRAIAIDRLILLLDGADNKAFWAILASSVLWTVPHIVTKPLSQLLGGILPGGLLFGYVYYKSRSILLPAWIHAVANAGYLGGLWIVGLYGLLSVCGQKRWFSYRHSPR
jgi:membrane protease YdiL (CAAX protease family)